ncbi:MAG: Serine/threonine-protein kinase tel1 [Alyxoria varia]|nr:MAG: Serine/threonine-protein kinase tel1 [Alyxoria varia]
MVVSLGDALVAIEKPKVTERDAGIADLKHIFKASHKSAEFKGLKDKALHKMFETLFRLVKGEKSAFLKSLKSTASRNIAESRLSSYAEAFRCAVEATVSRLKYKTLKAIFEHIIQILPTSDDEFCKPLSFHYLKALALLTGHQMHVEHLRQADWTETVDLCLMGISASSRASQPDSIGDVDLQLSGHKGSRRGFSTQGSTPREKQPADWRLNSASLFQSLRSLVTVSNCPLRDRSDTIIDTTIQFLIDNVSGTATLEAFETLNGVLVHISLEQGESTTECVRSLLPIMRVLWQRKEGELKDEMLKTLVLTKPYLKKLLASGDPDVRDEFEGLYESMYDDYFRFEGRKRGHLQSTDLKFGMHRPSLLACPLQSRHFYLRKSSVDSDHNWTLLYFLAFISSSLDANSSITRRDPEDDHDGPRKRRKYGNKFYETVAQSCEAPPSQRVYSLQLISFLTQHHNDIQVEELLHHLNLLERCIHHRGTDVASWAMLAIAGCSTCANAKDLRLQDFWLRIYHICSRMISSISHTRSACHLLHALLATELVSYVDIKDSIQSLIDSGAANGPATVSDSSVALWSSVRELVASKGLMGSVRECADQFVSWVSAKWNPSNFQVRQYASQLSKESSATDLANCPELKIPETGSVKNVTAFTTLHSLGLVWLERLKSKPLLGYLTLEHDAFQEYALGWNKTLETKRIPSLRYPEQAKVEGRLIEYLVSELDKAAQNWIDAFEAQSRHASADVLYMSMSLYLVSQVAAAKFATTHPSRLPNLRKKMGSLLELLKSHISADDSDPQVVETVVESIAPFLPNKIVRSKDEANIGVWETFVLRVSAAFSEPLGKKLTRTVDSQMEPALEEDEMDLDFPESQSMPYKMLTSNFPRHALAARVDSLSTSVTVASYLKLACDFSPQELNHDGQPESSSTRFVDFLLALPPSYFLANRSLFEIMDCSELVLSADDSEALLEYAAETFMMSYEFERCEVAIGTCLDLMKLTVSLWTDPQQESIHDIGGQMYSHFVGTAFTGGLLSPQAQKTLSNLLFTVHEINDGYVPSESCQSVRTTIFTVLKESNLDVQHHTSDQLPSIFGRYTLNHHDGVFEDVLKSLTNEASWIEGLAMRLLILSKLASAWQTLLRKCIYHIFETAGVVTEVDQYASHCINNITDALRIETPRALFKLFSSQLLYTWLKHQPLESIPFTVFGYSSLEDLLRDSRREIVSQTIMRGNDAHQQALEGLLNSNWKSLAYDSFDQAVAYAFALDSSTQQSQSSPTHNVENRALEIFGREEFVKLLKRRYPYVISHFLRRLDNEEQFERHVSHNSSYKHAADAYKEMKPANSTNNDFLPSQQPSFKSKFLMSEIERLCRRIGKDRNAIWTPFTISLVARGILNDMEDVLGSINSRRGIQRLRILICLSGKSCTEGYPLELLLHSLRPYVTDSLCAQDALGVFKYLLQRGKKYLQHNTQFLFGTALAIFLSMRNLLTSKHDSTTQESRHRETLSKADNFQKWLGEYVDQLRPSDIPESTLQKFRLMIKAARSMISAYGSSRHGYVSELLIYLLPQLSHRRGFLGIAFSELCFRLLVENFEISDSSRDDALANDLEASKYATHVWESCQTPSINRRYLAWASKVLGRSFHYDGRVPESVIAETKLSFMQDQSVTDSGLLPSKAAILKSLVDVLHSDNFQDLRLVEEALQRVLFVSRDSEDVHAIKNCLPDILSTAFAPEESLEVPEPDQVSGELRKLQNVILDTENKLASDWLHDVVLSLIRYAADDSMLGELYSAVQYISGLSQQLFPYLLHAVLDSSLQSGSGVQNEISESFRKLFQGSASMDPDLLRPVLQALLYLRTQPIKGEATWFDRNGWLELNYADAVNAAKRCKMYKTALMFIEIGQTRELCSSRRESSSRQWATNGLLKSIFEDMNDLDSYHGVPQTPTLDSVAARLAFEGGGTQELLIRGAQSDGLVKSGQGGQSEVLGSVINSLVRLNLNSITQQLSATAYANFADQNVMESMTKSALSLRQWDLPVPTAFQSNSLSIYRALQSVSRASNIVEVHEAIGNGLVQILTDAKGAVRTGGSLNDAFAAMAALSEADELLSVQSSSELQQHHSSCSSRHHWMNVGRLDDVSQILTTRAALLSMFSENGVIQDLLHLSANESRLVEVSSGLKSSTVLRSHGSLQESLVEMTYLSKLIDPCKRAGLRIEASVNEEIANNMWDRGEILPAIRIFQDLEQAGELESQSIQVGEAGMLSTLGHHISDARLQSPDEIMEHYLTRAEQKLKGSSSGSEAGKVFHQLASYCHAQLVNPDNAEELSRTQVFMQRRRDEVKELNTIDSRGMDKDELRKLGSDKSKASKWLRIDKEENKRLQTRQDDFLRQSLENYLKSLTASDGHDTDVLKFVALWFEYYANDIANNTVVKHFKIVPSRKFTTLMNQLASRLQDLGDTFQQILSALVRRICIEHPYHGMYHIFAGRETKGGNDKTAMSRNAAAVKIASKLHQSSQASTWTALAQSNEHYIKLACYQDKKNLRSGLNYNSKQIPDFRNVLKEVPKLQVPPITMTVAVRHNGDYSDMPHVVGFDSYLKIAGGISQPKVLKAIASNGAHFRQLFKSGDDDLRQDAIMEQVFEEVRSLLQRNRATRQRGLRIRTYKVIPLTASAGAIEFVPNTEPLNDYLRTAHSAYYPKDLKWENCRARMNDSSTEPSKKRITVYQDMTKKFHPVFRHFFFEMYQDPDTWYAARLAYTRSTAAISILGHAVGLGDRHCANILLDVSTGEVVHIDLGVAFEAGRVLQVPEVVPFRLTRDVVDGFGVMGTEGVFRRCCEFTLDALRTNKDAIMTLLNVLRYDPLYSWTMSPLRAKRLQEEQDREVEPSETAMSSKSKSARVSRSGGDLAASSAFQQGAQKKSGSKDQNDGGEADRALSVVEKKLSPGLSVMATVNELIQQASDEKNLALLFSGWASFA